SKRDWSSDVCSSDLHFAPDAHPDDFAGHRLRNLARPGDLESGLLVLRAVPEMPAEKADLPGVHVDEIDELLLDEPHENRLTVLRSEERRVGKEGGSQ